MIISAKTSPPTIHALLVALTVTLTAVGCQETTDGVAGGGVQADASPTDTGAQPVDAVGSGETRSSSENPFASGTCNPAGVWRLEYPPLTGFSLRPPEDRVRIEWFDRNLWAQYRVYWDGGCSATVYIGSAGPGRGACQLVLSCESRHTNVSEEWTGHNTLTITFNGDQATGETREWTSGFGATDGGTSAVTATRISP
jgi:hypothetical protein